ncbi:MAG: hotdog fold thioesterase [Alphaproteobacteria bacterium]
MGKSLGIEIGEVSKARVVATIALGQEHVTLGDAVQGGVVMAIADVTGALGAIVNLPPGYVTSTIESKSNFLKKGRGSILWAESEPVHVGRTTSVWRTQVFRGSEERVRERVAEVTQTQLHLPELFDSAESHEAPSAEETPTAEAAQHEGIGTSSLVDTRKRQILDGACKVMTRKGFAKSSVREIAEACGMPVPTMYKYVRSKEDILYLIYENFLSEFDRRLNASLSQPRPAEEQFRLALETTLSVFDQHHAYLKLLFRETASLNAVGRKRVFALDRAYIKKWTSLIESIGADRRMNVDAELLANIVYYLTTVWAMRHWAIGKWGFEAINRAIGSFVSRAMLPAHETRATNSKHTVGSGRSAARRYRKEPSRKSRGTL